MTGITSKALRELQGAIDGRVERKSPKMAQTVTGTVTGAKAGALRVLVDGAAESTPVDASACDVSVGDAVTCVISDGSMSITGNTTAPATSQKAVNATVAPVADEAARARLAADSAVADAASASKLATTAAAEAAEISETLGQHFWSDDGGAHVTDVPMEEWQTAEASDFPDASDTKQYSNILLNSLGMLIRAAKKTLVSVSRSAISFFDGSGSDAANVVATFGADGAQIGRAGESHIEQDYHSFKMVDKNGNTYVHFSDLRNEDGYYSYARFFLGNGVADTDSPTGYSVICENPSLISESDTVTSAEANGDAVDGCWMDKYQVIHVPVTDESTYDITVVLRTSSSLAKAYTLGTRGRGSLAEYSYAIGHNVDAKAPYSVAIGDTASASGSNSTAIGTETSASGGGSVALGSYASAEGKSAVAIGPDARTKGELSFAIGDRATATDKYSFALGIQATATGGDMSIKAASDINLQSPVKAEDALDVAGAATLNGAFAHTANGVSLTYPGAWLSALYGGMEQLTQVSDIIAPGSAVNVKQAVLVKWGRVRNLWIYWTPKNKITVPATGDISNITIGTLTEGNRPVAACAGQTDNGGIGPGWYTCNYQGVLTLDCLNGTGSSRTIAAGTYAVVLMTYLA